MDPNQINRMNQINYNQNYYEGEEVDKSLYTTGNLGVNNLNLTSNSNYQQYYQTGLTNLNSLSNINTMSEMNNYNNIPQNTSYLIPNQTNQSQYYNLNILQHQQQIQNQLQNQNQIQLQNQIQNHHQNQISLQDKPWNKASKEIQKGTELFVGNLSLDTGENDLYEVFRDCGEIIDIRVHKNAQTKKCYAFIRFSSKEMLRLALNKNLMTLKGRKMKVTKSNENSTIFIGNIRKNWSNFDVETKVKRIFPNSEKIEHFPDPNQSNKNRGFCFVMFKNRNEAIKALNYVASKGGINIDGVPLTCDWADVVDEDDSNSKQIFIAGLDESVDETKLREVFGPYGNIVDIVLSKLHKSSKRKDLAFITFETHEMAKTAVDTFKNIFVNYENDHEDNIIINNDNLGKLDNPLGSNVNISLAFSQQAMQAKKKIKESRKKVTPISTTTITPAQVITSAPLVSKPKFDASAMLAMMNLINLNKNNMNISPTLMTQMMAACFESMLNQNTENTQSSPSISNSLNNITSLNIPQTGLNPLNPLISSFNPPQILNQGSNPLINNKRLRKNFRKKRPNVSLKKPPQA